MKWVFAVLVCVLAVELFLRLPIFDISRTILATSRKSYRVISSRLISDCWKEKAVQRYSMIMFTRVLLLAACFVLLGASLAGLLYLGDLVEAGISGYMASIRGIFLTTVLATLYIFLRNRFVP
jgi:hypothetical protein